jgi:hypothetical protein
MSRYPYTKIFKHYRKESFTCDTTLKNMQFTK